MVSHGTGGSADAMDWVAAPLAAAGYIVVAVDHPSNNALEPKTWDGFILWWDRATDLSEALDGVLADPILGPHINRDRIGALGFSLGGYTVLELAGARTDFAAFLAFCTSPAADAVCHPPEMDRVGGRLATESAPSPERQASLARSGASYRDNRIKAVFAIAPSVGQAFDANSFAEVNIPIGFVAGDADVNVPLATNVRHIVSLYPGASLAVLPGAGHYTFLPVCAPAMTAAMPQLCTDNAGTDRAAIHQQAIIQVGAFFSRTLHNEADPVILR
jgi:predicted dienelactone hydrolase